MRVTSVSATYPIRTLYNNKKLTSPSFTAKSMYQTQNEREYLISAISKVKDLTPSGGGGFIDTLNFLRETDFKTYGAVVRTLGDLPQGSTMKYSSLNATSLPFKRGKCVGVKVNFDIQPSSSQKTYNSSEERYGANLSARGIASNVIVENTAHYLENKNSLNGVEKANLSILKQYISNNSSAYFYMPVL